MNSNICLRCCCYCCHTDKPIIQNNHFIMTFSGLLLAGYCVFVHVGISFGYAEILWDRRKTYRVRMSLRIRFIFVLLFSVQSPSIRFFATAIAQQFGFFFLLPEHTRKGWLFSIYSIVSSFRLSFSLLRCCLLFWIFLCSVSRWLYRGYNILVSIIALFING